MDWLKLIDERVRIFLHILYGSIWAMTAAPNWGANDYPSTQAERGGPDHQHVRWMLVGILYYTVVESCWILENSGQRSCEATPLHIERRRVLTKSQLVAIGTLSIVTTEKEYWNSNKGFDRLSLHAHADAYGKYMEIFWSITHMHKYYSKLYYGMLYYFM